MPFGSYQASPQQAFENASKLMAAGAHMIELEAGRSWPRPRPSCPRGAFRSADIWASLRNRWTRSVASSFKVPGKTEDAAQCVLDDAKQIEAAGAVMIVFEAIPGALGKAVAAALSIPTIGIGARPDCSGQILLLYDMLDFFPGRKAKFVKKFMAGAGSLQAAVEGFVREVKAGTIPSPEYCY